MIRRLSIITAIVFAAMAPIAHGQVKNFTPVTQDMLLKPPAEDWLMPSRTYDWQRFSPLNQINKQNVGQLALTWVRELGPGTHETIPIVHNGVMYVAAPGPVIEALDATTGDLLWEHSRKLPDDIKQMVDLVGRARVVAIYDDMIFYSSPDGFIIALDARTGEIRWQAKTQDYTTGTRHTSGPIVVNGKVISGRSCANDPFIKPRGSRETCFIAGHDAKTGKELWKFFTAAGPDEPNGNTWGNTPADKRTASPWGLPGAYDPVRNLIFWGIGNPSPYPRLKRHLGNIEDVPQSAPVDLYSDSTVAINADTGKLAWYYQQLPGDDWDLDAVHERLLIRTALNPDASQVKWINPRIARGQQRDIVVDSPEQGGLWVVDRDNGQFLWATPFPYDTPEWGISRVDVETGKTYLNWDLVFRKEGDRHIVCYEDQKGWYPMSYHPGKNSLYIPYNDFCIDMKEKLEGRQGWEIRNVVPRPGSDPNKLGGIAKVNMTTGQITRFYTAPVGGKGATLATAGDLIFWGDEARKFRAFDADSGKILWDTTLGGSIENSTITYSVNGKQYVAVLTAQLSGLRKYLPNATPAPGHNAVYVFALPEKR